MKELGQTSQCEDVYLRNRSQEQRRVGVYAEALATSPFYKYKTEVVVEISVLSCPKYNKASQSPLPSLVTSRSEAWARWVLGVRPAVAPLFLNHLPNPETFLIFDFDWEVSTSNYRSRLWRNVYSSVLEPQDGLELIKRMSTAWFVVK